MHSVYQEENFNIIACGRYFDSKKLALSYHLISCLLGERVRKQSTIVGALEKELICQVIRVTESWLVLKCAGSGRSLLWKMISGPAYSEKDGE